MNSALIFLSILFPVAIGIICLGIKNHKARAGLVIFTACVLILTSILFFCAGKVAAGIFTFRNYRLGQSSYYSELCYHGLFYCDGCHGYCPQGFFQTQHFTHNIYSHAGLPLALFEFKWAPGTEVSPALYIDHLSLVLTLVVSIVGSLICLYAIRYMKDHEEHRIHAGELQGTAQPRFFFFMLTFLGVMNGLVFANNLLWLAFSGKSLHSAAGV